MYYKTKQYCYKFYNLLQAKLRRSMLLLRWRWRRYYSKAVCILCRSLHNNVETLPEHLSSSPVFSALRVAQSLVFCVVFCRSMIVLSIFAIVLSVILRFTASDYPFGIFNLLYRLTLPEHLFFSMSWYFILERSIDRFTNHCMEVFVA